MKKEQVLRVVVVEPDKKPRVDFIKNELSELQATVGGYIETLTIDNGVDIICNEEGKINGLELNRPLYHEGEIWEIIAGTFFIAGYDDEGEFISLTQEQIEKYMGQFAEPLYFVKLNGKIVAVPRKMIDELSGGC